MSSVPEKSRKSWKIGPMSRKKFYGGWQVCIYYSNYRIAGKFGGGKVWRIGHLEVLAKESLANIEDLH